MTIEKITNFEDLQNGDLAKFAWPNGTKITGRVNIPYTGPVWLTLGDLGTGGRVLAEGQFFISAKRAVPDEEFPEGTRVQSKTCKRGVVTSETWRSGAYFSAPAVDVRWDDGTQTAYYVRGLKKIPLQPGDRVTVRKGAKSRNGSFTAADRPGTVSAGSSVLWLAVGIDTPQAGRVVKFYLPEDVRFVGPALPKTDKLDALREKLGEAMKILEDEK